MENVRNHLTPCGFRYGAALVERKCDYDGHVVISILTDDGKELDVRVSPQGRRLRVSTRGVEWVRSDRVGSEADRDG